MPTIVRDALKGDIAYIAKTLAMCLRETGIGRHADWPSLHKECAMLLDVGSRDGWRLLVACDEKDRDALVGYALGDPPTIHHVYVRAEFRGSGIARQLLDKLGPCSRFTFPASRRTSLTKHLTYAPRFTHGHRGRP